MQILQRNQYSDLMAYVPRIKPATQDWRMVDLRITEDAKYLITTERMAELVFRSFRDKEGRIYICNDREVLMFVLWGHEQPSEQIAEKVIADMPPNSCEVHTQTASPEGIAKLEILITSKGTPSASTVVQMRESRRENVYLIADDDAFMRLVLQKALQASNTTIHEAKDGGSVIAAYKQYAPDILFLDIHMPGLDGMGALREIASFDPKAYIVMLSADSSTENVEATGELGAVGFLAKPINPEKLKEYIAKCPTLS